MTIKERITELCKEQSISVNQFEKEVGVSKGYVSKLGKDGSVPNAKKISQMADRLNVSVDYLVNGTLVEVSKNTAQEERLLTYFRKLSDLEKSEVMGFVLGKTKEE